MVRCLMVSPVSSEYGGGRVAPHVRIRQPVTVVHVRMKHNGTRELGIIHNQRPQG